MAEWMEVMNQFGRMCRHYQRKRGCPMDCPMVGLNVSQCRKVAFEQPKITERTIMDWAAEHPVVYPTWYEYLSDYYRAAFGDMSVISKQPIPADIAEKLGIEPIK